MMRVKMTRALRVRKEKVGKVPARRGLLLRVDQDFVLEDGVLDDGSRSARGKRGRLRVQKVQSSVAKLSNLFTGKD